MDNIASTILEIILYILAAGSSMYFAVEAAPLGLSLFAASGLILCFAGAAWSLYKMLVREPS